MRILKIKFFLFFALCAIISIYAVHVSAHHDSPSTTQQTSIKGGGTIVMSDIIMAVTVNDSQDPVQNVVVLNAVNEPVFQGSGCGSHQCSYDLSSVASGSYTAVVYTEQGDSFSENIQL